MTQRVRHLPRLFGKTFALPAAHTLALAHTAIPASAHKALQTTEVTMGAGYRRIDGTFDGTFQVQIPDQSNDPYSAFLQDEINLVADRLWPTLDRTAGTGIPGYSFRRLHFPG